MNTEAACRTVLAKLAHNRSILVREVPLDALAELEGRRLIRVPFAGHIEASTRAQGYAHDPSTFSL